MPAPTMTIKIKAGHRLMARIREASRHLEMTPANFIEYSLESELQRQEEHLRHEHVTMQALHQDVLAAGQSISIHLEADDGERATCQLCLRAIEHGAGVDGPLLCDACYALAKGDRVAGSTAQKD